MTDGLRDQFVENDVIGNYAVGTSLMGGLARSSSRKRRKKSHRKVPTRRRHRKRRVKLHRKRRGKSIKRSKGGIHFTKKGQPYKIMPNGRARFIKK